MKKQPLRISIISILFALFFSGCLTKELPAYNTYALKLHEPQMTPTVFYNSSILITQPLANPSLKVKNIIYTHTLKYESYALSLWSDEPTIMIQKMMSSYLARLHQYKYITQKKIAEKTNYTLYSQLLNFEHDTQNFQTIFAIRVYLKNNVTQKLIAKDFSYKEKVSKNNAHEAVVHLNKSVNQFVKELNGFIQKNL